MATILYKQNEFSKWNIDEFLTWINEDETGAEWLELMARRVTIQMKELGSKEFGIESAKELIAASITKGYFVPFKKVEEK